MKIRRKDKKGNYYLVRPYLRPNLDDLGNVESYSIVGKSEDISLNIVQDECYRRLCIEISIYLGRLIRNRNRFDCDVRDFPSEQQVRNLLSGRTGPVVWPVREINLESDRK